jgi:hypothetical protein
MEVELNPSMNRDVLVVSRPQNPLKHCRKERKEKLVCYMKKSISSLFYFELEDASSLFLQNVGLQLRLHSALGAGEEQGKCICLDICFNV